MADEFSLIETWFAPLSREIGDDCALLALEPGERLAVSVDTLVEGVHFLAGTDPQQISYRAVVTALSDLAAMGAAPRGITLALTLPDSSDAWLEPFSRGLRDVLEKYELELLGGDTTRGPLTITVQVLGSLPADKALQRSGAQVGEDVYISGCTGDAAAALAQQQGEWPGDPAYADYLEQRFFRPTARIELGQRLLNIASSAIDVSDGLLADAGHICERSGVGMVIDAQSLPLSLALRSSPDRDRALDWALSGGDDYELLFTVPGDKAHLVPEGCTRIGSVVEGDAVHCDVQPIAPGYQHFSPAGVDPVTGENIGEPAGAVQPQPFRSPAQFFAFGFGSGLSPVAPGTVGTLAAIPLYLLLAGASLPVYSALLVLAFGFGVWVSGLASRELKVHDHGGIVWDEFVGFWITMWAMPPSLSWVLAGFVLFRIFDVAKPWPIGWFDRRVHGGLGIMIDDVIAGIFSCALLHLLMLIL